MVFQPKKPARLSKIQPLALAITLLIPLAPGDAMAETKIPTSLKDCKAPQTQIAMNFCAKLDFEASDKKLNTAYVAARKYMKNFDTNVPEGSRDGVNLLLQAQRAWIDYRDKACASEGYLSQGGTIQPLIIFECKSQLTDRRTKDLLAIVSQD